jgi:hypothetical protein
MNHSDAITSKAAAGYLLGDLSEAERDAFEMHYIDCPICAETVWSGQKMFAAGREIVRETGPAPIAAPVLPPATEPRVLPFRQRLGLWVPSAAAAALAVVVALQGFVLRRPALLPLPLMEIAVPAGTIGGTTRGTQEDLVIRFDEGKPAEVFIEPPVRDPYPRYVVELRGAEGNVIGAVPVSAKQALHSDGVAVVLRALPAGRYVLELLGVREDGNRPVSVRKQSVVVQ